MTEAEWLSCGDLWTLVEAYHVQARPRKLRLFVRACCGRVAHLMEHEALAALDVAERYADGLVGPAELSRARDAARQAEKRRKHRLVGSAHRESAQAARLAVNDQIALVVAQAVWCCRHGMFKDYPGACLRDTFGAFIPLLREVYGNPVRLPAVAPAWLTPDLLALARVAYSDRAAPSGDLSPAGLAVLSDALEEAGCAEGELLGHLRSPGPHVRGCWALDLLLGKS